MDPAGHPRARPGAVVAARDWRRVRARLRRSLRPPRTLRPTRAGWVFFALTFGVGFAALNTGNNLLYLVLAFMLSFLVLSGVLSESALRGVQVRRRSPREVFAGQPAPMALEISNSQRRVPSFALVVEDLAGGGGGIAAGSVLGRVFALRVAAEGTETRTYPLACRRRGELRFSGFRVSTRFPFGLFSKAMLLPAEGEVLVYPAVDPSRVEPPAERGRREGERADPRRGAGCEVTGLREFATGDSGRRVHWRTSLRRGELFVRDADSELDGQVEVRLPTRVRPGARFEAAVRRAASEVVAFLDAGFQVALTTDASRLEPGAGPWHRARLLGLLARVQPDPAGDGDAGAEAA